MLADYLVIFQMYCTSMAVVSSHEIFSMSLRPLPALIISQSIEGRQCCVRLAMGQFVVELPNSAWNSAFDRVCFTWLVLFCRGMVVRFSVLFLGSSVLMQRLVIVLYIIRILSSFDVVVVLKFGLWMNSSEQSAVHHWAVVVWIMSLPLCIRCR